MSIGSERRALSLTSHLFTVLVVGSIVLGLVVTQVAADRAAERSASNQHAREHALGLALAGRAAPLIERGDEVRLALLATTTADIADGRVLVLDVDGRVRVDTGRALLGDRLELASVGGSRRRLLDQDGTWEVCAPAHGYAGVVGEVRVRYSLAPEGGQFAWDLFVVVLLCCLSLIALAAWICHTWGLRLRELASRVRECATGANPALPDGPSSSGGPVGEVERAVGALVAARSASERETANTVQRLGREIIRSLEQRGHVPVGHAERTRRLCVRVASDLGLDETQQRSLADAALLHDLGKIAVRTSALEKTSGLDDAERASLRQHAQRGASLLSGVTAFAAVAETIRHQHEKWDGSGYPDGLRGERIPLSSRILSIASAFDLLTSEGGQHPACSWPDALDELHRDRGEHFDPDLLDFFEESIRRSPPAPARGDCVLISTRGAVPYKAADEDRRSDDEIDADAILAFGLADLEVLGDEGEDTQ